MYENIGVEFDAGVVTVTLNRPEKLNAFAGHMRRDLAEALEHASSDPEARVVVITGAGRAFSTGADVGRMNELMERGDLEEMRRLLG
ncbi:MAG TPA: enoyl-CoA hydratase/isomerase family protein, partial [Pyrinomonadaceae bacterium]|nr:enoyl-CoA hydratase/isomerase family protein [Pyrinomonadaceae bacterium]